jgi:hypothetical protein
LSITALPADFSITVTPATLSIDTGGSQNVTVSVAPVNGFTSSVGVTLSGLPSGVTASPSTFSLASGGQQLVALAASGSAAVGKATVTFAGTSGSLSQSAQTSVNVVAAVSGAHAPIRTRFLRTNSFFDVDSWQYVIPPLTVYDRVHRQFFVSKPFLNQIDVFDAVQQIKIAQIAVPQPFGLDISPYNGNLYAGTAQGDVFQIDTAKFTVIKRFPASSIGPAGFQATEALVLSDGRLALQGPGNTIDGYRDIVVWDPETNSLDTGSYGVGGVCAFSGGAFALSGDRTRILVTGVFYSSAGAPVCSYDPIAQQVTTGTIPFTAREFIPTPDGTRFFAINPIGFAVFDTKTLQMLGQSAIPIQYLVNSSDLGSAVMSTDGKTLYLGDYLSGEVGTFDTTTLAQTGWIPSFLVRALGAVDETGLIVGPTDYGLGFLDAARMQTKQPTWMHTPFTTPPTGPLAGGTAISNFVTADVTDGATLSQVYVGNMPGTDSTFASSSTQGNTAATTTPPSSLAGAVDMTVVLSDGSVSTLPEGFSYGPTILQVVPNGATAEGGQTGTIIGYGFGGPTGQFGPVSGVTVTVGGKAATGIVGRTGAPFEPYPFATDELQFSIPPGTSGSAVDVTVTTASGSATASGAFHYVAETQTFPLPDTLQEGIYDAGRNLLSSAMRKRCFPAICRYKAA